MTDELQPESSQQGNAPEAQVSVPLSAQPPKSNKKLWMIVTIVVIALCLCLVAFVALFGTSLYKVSKEKSPVESVLDDYMEYMVNKDAESAYALFSPRIQRQFPISKIQDLLDGNNYILFEGYQNLSVSNLNISKMANTNPDAPQGTVAKVTGAINFEGGIQGSFNGTLEKVDGVWMIDGIFITVPPEKIK
jgi:hypothetical protein